jgi:hypothetical protein
VGNLYNHLGRWMGCFSPLCSPKFVFRSYSRLLPYCTCATVCSSTSTFSLFAFLETQNQIEYNSLPFLIFGSFVMRYFTKSLVVLLLGLDGHLGVRGQTRQDPDTSALPFCGVSRSLYSLSVISSNSGVFLNHFYHHAFYTIRME